MWGTYNLDPCLQQYDGKNSAKSCTASCGSHSHALVLEMHACNGAMHQAQTASYDFTKTRSFSVWAPSRQPVMLSTCNEVLNRVVAGNVWLAGKICLVGCGLVPLQNQDFKENDYHAMSLAWFNLTIYPVLVAVSRWADQPTQIQQVKLGWILSFLLICTRSLAKTSFKTDLKRQSLMRLFETGFA